jgi:hypothetical protein
MRRFTTDAPTVAFDDEASGITTDADGDTQFDWQAVETVTIDDMLADSSGESAQAGYSPQANRHPHANAFETTEFYKLPATVAKPIAQPYNADGDVIWLQKPWQELRDAAWSLDNTPWTLGHPDTGVVQDTADIRGFWSNPRAIEATHDLDADLHVPVDDTDAQQFIADTGDVSVGFFNGVTDQYDTDVSPDTDVELDGYQTDLLFNHVASVQRGRCPSSKGCGIAQADEACHTPDAQQVVDGQHATGTVTKALERRHTLVDSQHGDMDLSVPASAQQAAQDFRDAVERGDVPDSCGGPNGLGRRRAQQFADGGELSLETWVTGGTSAVANWHARHEGSESPDADDPWADCGYAMFHAWGGETARNKAMRLKEQMNETQDTNMTRHTADAVGDWVQWSSSGGPAYGKIVDTVTEGCTTRGKGSQEVCAEDDDPVAIVEVYDNESGESKDEEVRHKMSSLNTWSNPPSTSDALKDTPITDTNTVNTTDAPSGIYTTDDGMMFAVAPDEHPDENTNHADDAKYPVNNCEDVVDAWNLRGQGNISISRDTLETRIMRVAESEGCDMPATAETDEFDITTQMCNGCTDNSGIDMSFGDLTPEVALDKLAAEHDDIASYLTDLRESADAANEAADELDVDTDQLADTAAVHDERVSELEDKLSDLRRPKMEEDAQFIAERTDRFGEDASAVLDTVDDIEDLEAKRELVEDLTADTSETTANVDDGGEMTVEAGGYVSTPWE